MDRLDREIIRMLQADGRISHEQIAKQISLSRPAVHDRIRRLESAGVVRGYAAQVDWDSLGYSVGAFIFVRLMGKTSVVAQQIFRLASDEVIIEGCHRTAGDWCLLVHIRANSPGALQQLLDDIREIPNVQNTMTTIALSTILPDESAALISAQPTLTNNNYGKS